MGAVMETASPEEGRNPDEGAAEVPRVRLAPAAGDAAGAARRYPSIPCLPIKILVPGAAASSRVAVRVAVGGGGLVRPNIRMVITAR